MGKAIQLSALTANRYYDTQGAQKEIYLYLELKGGAATTTQERLPLNLSLVLDRSGSMAGDKLHYVKKAARFIIQNLSSSDHLSLVQYDTVVETLSPQARVTSKKQLYQQVDRIHHRNMTNLSGGLLEGYQQVRSIEGQGRVNRVLLLTDGLANRGIVHPEELQRIARQHFREKGVALSTFGVGADFNENLLTGLSEHGGGNYYFIDSPDKIPTIFADELKGLLAVVAQNARLRLNFPGALKCRKVYGFPADVRSDHLTINFNDVHSEEEKAVLIAFTVDRTPDADLVFSTIMEYVDAQKDYETVSAQVETLVSLTTDENILKSGREPAVLEQVTLFLATDLYEKAVTATEQGQYPEAQRLIDEAITMVRTHLRLYGPNEELQRLLGRLEEYRIRHERVEFMSTHDRSLHMKSGRYMSYMSRRKKP